jgi:hypothetical protein
VTLLAASTKSEDLQKDLKDKTSVEAAKVVGEHWVKPLKIRVLKKWYSIAADTNFTELLKPQRMVPAKVD